jgi:membrane protease YdiL (CAAX protease family)
VDTGQETLIRQPRAVLRNEVLLVLGVSLGSSAVYSVLSFIEKATRAVALAQQTTTMNDSVTPDRPWLDLAIQLTRITLLAVPALLAIHLLRRDHPAALSELGIDRHHPGFDAGTGAALALMIGIPGIGLYLATHALGINTAVAASNLVNAWWVVPVLVLSAAGNGILEEIVVIGYLMTRLRDLGCKDAQIVAASALLRGTYHLYQGWGAFIGNAVMGVVFGLFFLRFKRVLPLIIAHTLLDVGAFVGYRYLSGVVNLP